MVDDTVKLKACPFCGGEAALYHHTPGSIDDSWHVECSNADGGGEGCGCGTCHHDTAAEAIAAWNTRAPSGGRDEALADRVSVFVDHYFAPWGAWKTAWWEGEVSDNAAYSAENALKHVANMVSSALKNSSEPAPASLDPGKASDLDPERYRK